MSSKKDEKTSWIRRSTSTTVDTYVEVDIDLEKFETPQLLQELIDRKVLTQEAAVRLLAGIGTDAPGDESDLEIANAEIRAGRRIEALIHLERFLGRDWVGRLQ